MTTEQMTSRQQTMFPLLWGRGTLGLEHGTFMREIVPADNVPSLVGQGNMGPGTWNIHEGSSSSRQCSLSCVAGEHGTWNKEHL